jgi:phospholipid transport system substrate-binding protein
MFMLKRSIPVLFGALALMGVAHGATVQTPGLANRTVAEAKITNPKPGATPPGKTDDGTAAQATTKTPARTATKAPGKTGAKASKTGVQPVAGTGGSGGGETPGDADDKDVAPVTPPAGLSPLAELKKSNDQLDKLLRKKYPGWSPEAEAQKADVRKLVGGFLDYRELAHRSLAKHWEALKPAQRQDFVATLRELVERSYLKQIRGDPNYTVKYQREEKTGSEATVEATLSTVARNKKVTIAIVYKLVYKSHWLVYDVITDEQSMLENYRAEFNKIINKEGFDALLKRMKKKMEEKDE